MLPVPVEFHISRKAREKYEFDDSLFSASGNVVIANFTAARLFADKMNTVRSTSGAQDDMVRAAEVNSLGLIDEMLHQIIAIYRSQVNPRVFNQAAEWLREEVGDDALERTMLKFVEEFPPIAVYQKRIAAPDYLAGQTDGVPNRMICLEEMLLLWLANLNPAFTPFLELFDHSVLAQQTPYVKLMNSLSRFFVTQPKFGPGKTDLFSLLRQPAIVRPHSLREQLLFITGTWGFMLSSFMLRMMRGLDFLKEESKPVFHGPPPTEVLEFGAGSEEDVVEHEPEQFSPDLHWMPNLVLIAKSTLVWLDQLSKKYERNIQYLNQIPDEELDALARWGFTGLWLIGIWQRSAASQKVKRMCGNPEAESSAYSLFDYEIAPELGGAPALDDLRSRCWSRGLRLACDMVPNHTGLDSKWTRENPHWFIGLPYSPFPSYSFGGPNLSDDARYGIRIEDKYFNQTDAAVVFKHEDYWTGDVRYIYHGNDGTNMPWNDTAQLDYLNPEVREAVIQKIIDVARMFPVIRFDAAMTLARKHFHRLWYPEPGSGGDIPSRSEFGLTKRELNQLIPNEFWRELVDRVAQAVPDCLLLAEAFWLMEGYFVRTLGMHRVYNSAFMNMLKNEENQKYRRTVINTIQFEPEILKRYVNFMNNPDEDTAVEQFGDGDKYFGVCMLLATMPGLPMFGHGQIEGLREKYGMEYRRAYWDEQVNTGLVERHERDIFPLLKKRYLFAEVENFLFYNFVTSDNYVNENVFAYSNRTDDEAALVIFHNKYDQTRGWVRASVPFVEKVTDNSETTLVQRSLQHGLNLPLEPSYYVIYKDLISGLEYIRSNRAVVEEGLFFELQAYEYHVFTDFFVVQDNDEAHYGQVHEYLDGRGVPSLVQELQEIELKPVLEIVDDLLSYARFKEFCDARTSLGDKKWRKALLDPFRDGVEDLFARSKEFKDGTANPRTLAKNTLETFEAGLRLDAIGSRFRMSGSKALQRALSEITEWAFTDERQAATLYSWLILHGLGKLQSEEDYGQAGAAILEEWPLDKRIEGLVSDCAASEAELPEPAHLLPILCVHQDWFLDEKPVRLREHRILRTLLADPRVRGFLMVNRFEDVFWFNKERFQTLLPFLLTIAVIKITSGRKTAGKSIAERILAVHRIVEKWRKSADASEYKVEHLLSGLQPAPRSVKRKPKKRSVARSRKPKPAS